MAFEYFLYDTNYSNTIVDRSDISFTPTPPYYEIYIDYFIPKTQPLYLYKESGGNVILNDQSTIDNYLNDNMLPSVGNDYVNYYTYSGYTGITNNRLDIIEDSVSGLTNTRLNSIENNINYISGVTTGKLNTSLFNSFTGTTLPNTYLDKSSFNVYSGLTNTNINGKVSTTLFNTFTGNTLPTSYYNRSEINSYTGITNTLIGTKAPSVSPTFIGVPLAPTAVVNTNTTQIATTAFVVGQATATLPLMDGSVSIGTSLRYARGDHRHPSNNNKVNKTGDTIIGTLCITNGSLVVSGTTTSLSTLNAYGLNVYGNGYVTGNACVNGNFCSVGSLFGGNVTKDVNQQNVAVIDNVTKKIANSTISFATITGSTIYGSQFYNAQDLTTTTIASVTPTYSTKISITTSAIPAGKYKITGSYGMNKGVTNRDMLSRIQVDGVTLGDIHNHELGDASTWLYTTRVMFITFGTSSTHTISLQFSQESSGTLSIRDSSLEIIRVS